MKFTSGTQVWIRCEDGEWWPAKIRSVDPDLRSFLGPGEDCFAEFYHNPGQLYPITSNDAHTVRAFHRRASEQSVEEMQWMHTSATKAAVEKALKDSAVTEIGPPAARQPLLGADPDRQAAQGTPFSADELTNIRQLLGAVSAATASQIQQQLAQEGIQITPGSISKLRNKELAHRKRHRDALTASQSRAVTRLESASLLDQDRLLDVHTELGTCQNTPTRSPEPRFADSEDDQSSSRDKTDTSTSASDGFVPPAEQEVLDVIRAEVFEDTSKLALSPVYNFLDLLGAVSVENSDLYTALAAPQATREVPVGGFEKTRRVLLVPLSNEYSHTMGWMRPLEVDGRTLSMELEVNGVTLPVPSNWNVAAAKEAKAVKTAPVCDITDLVLAASDESLIKLHVRFLNAMPDMELWMGVITCVFVEKLELPQLADRIVRIYTSPRMSTRRLSTPGNAVVATTSGTVSIICPISAQVMTTPVRSTTCQHLQCMDLISVLSACAHANIWNCALCGEPISPNKVQVNYRLRDWLASHRHLLSKVKSVLETPPGEPLAVQYREEHHTEAVDIDD